MVVQIEFKMTVGIVAVVKLFLFFTFLENLS